MKYRVTYYFFILVLILLAGCTILHTQQLEMVTCPVCNERISTESAFEYKYQGKKYYFHSYNCKEVFKMNPEKFAKKETIENKQ